MPHTLPGLLSFLPGDPAGAQHERDRAPHVPAQGPHEVTPAPHEFHGHEILGQDRAKYESVGHELSGPGFSGHEIYGQDRDDAGYGGGTGTGPPGREVPPTGTVPLFPPLPVRRAGVGRLWPGRPPGRGLVLALLALCGGLLLAVPPSGAGAPAAKAASGAGRAKAHGPRHTAADRRSVRTAVRIAEPAGLRLVRPGDRVDVIAVKRTGPRAAHVVVAGARVVALPRPPESTSSPSGGTTAPLPGPSPESAETGVWPGADAETRWDATDSGAVVVLTVPRASALELAAASASSALAVVAC